MFELKGLTQRIDTFYHMTKERYIELISLEIR